ncbi:MAG: ribosomal RNA small subunit methyltransferase A [candidate division Zixibacteria bacterium]|nr:ribosomal RNA small subunit methyltransferase A [candidate division Zixibacteria bacterium]
MSRKSLSQYFLTNKRIAERIAKSLGDVPPGSMVVEIGGGRGRLTEALTELYDNVKVVEIDRGLAGRLSIEFSGKADVINNDILKIDPASLNSGGAVYLCGNIPYHISGLLMRWISDKCMFFPVVVLMVQKEVARRICRGEGSKEYGVLSIVSAIDFHPEYLFTVGAGSFNPRPKVDSGVIRLSRRSESLIEMEGREGFIDFIKVVFSQRRKKIRNNLKGIEGLEVEEISDILEQEGFDIDKRPGEFSARELVDMYRIVKTKI